MAANSSLESILESRRRKSEVEGSIFGNLKETRNEGKSITSINDHDHEKPSTSRHKIEINTKNYDQIQCNMDSKQEISHIPDSGVTTTSIPPSVKIDNLSIPNIPSIPPTYSALHQKHTENKYGPAESPLTYTNVDAWGSESNIEQEYHHEVSQKPSSSSSSSSRSSSSVGDVDTSQLAKSLSNCVLSPISKASDRSKPSSPDKTKNNVVLAPAAILTSGSTIASNSQSSGLKFDYNAGPVDCLKADISDDSDSEDDIIPNLIAVEDSVLNQWKLNYTENGDPYYLNAITGESSWTLPDINHDDITKKSEILSATSSDSILCHTPENKNIRRANSSASSSNSIILLPSLVCGGYSVLESDTILHTSVSSMYTSDKDVDTHLMNSNHSVSVLNEFGESPLHHACVHGYWFGITALLNAGVGVNVVDYYGRTPLYPTIIGNSEHSVEILEHFYNMGASIDTIDFKGDTLLHIGIASQNIQCTKFILKKQPKLISHKNEQSNTPLHIAAAIGNIEIMKALAASTSKEILEQLSIEVNISMQTPRLIAITSGSLKEYDSHITSVINKSTAKQDTVEYKHQIQLVQELKNELKFNEGKYKELQNDFEKHKLQSDETVKKLSQTLSDCTIRQGSLERSLEAASLSQQKAWRSLQDEELQVTKLKALIQTSQSVTDAAKSRIVQLEVLLQEASSTNTMWERDYNHLCEAYTSIEEQLYSALEEVKTNLQPDKNSNFNPVTTTNVVKKHTVSDSPTILYTDSNGVKTSDGNAMSSGIIYSSSNNPKSVGNLNQLNSNEHDEHNFDTVTNEANNIVTNGENNEAWKSEWTKHHENFNVDVTNTDVIAPGAYAVSPTTTTTTTNNNIPTSPERIMQVWGKFLENTLTARETIQESKPHSNYEGNEMGMKYSNIFEAVNSNAIDEVKALLLSGESSDATLADNGDSLLHIACKNGFKDILVFLVELEADVNITIENGNTPMHNTVLGGHVDCLRYLLQSMAVPTQNSNGDTPLHIAVTKGLVDCIRLLLQYDTDISQTLLKNVDGDSAYTIALRLSKKNFPSSSTRHNEAVILLKNHMEAINETNNSESNSMCS